MLSKLKHGGYFIEMHLSHDMACVAYCQEHGIPSYQIEITVIYYEHYAFVFPLGTEYALELTTEKLNRFEQSVHGVNVGGTFGAVIWCSLIYSDNCQGYCYYHYQCNCLSFNLCLETPFHRHSASGYIRTCVRDLQTH